MNGPRLCSALHVLEVRNNDNQSSLTDDDNGDYLMIDCSQGDGEGRPTRQLGHLVAGGRGRQSGGVFMSSQGEFAFLFHFSGYRNW